jgi:hypothetical protein
LGVFNLKRCSGSERSIRHFLWTLFPVSEGNGASLPGCLHTLADPREAKDVMGENLMKCWACLNAEDHQRIAFAVRRYAGRLTQYRLYDDAATAPELIVLNCKVVRTALRKAHKWEQMAAVAELEADPPSPIRRRTAARSR